jgi:hypothetical protein
VASACGRPISKNFDFLNTSAFMKSDEYLIKSYLRNEICITHSIHMSSMAVMAHSIAIMNQLICEFILKRLKLIRSIQPIMVEVFVFQTITKVRISANYTKSSPEYTLPPCFRLPSRFQMKSSLSVSIMQIYGSEHFEHFLTYPGPWSSLLCANCSRSAINHSYVLPRPNTFTSRECCASISNDGCEALVGPSKRIN